ncbi:MAG: hypothetical protein N3E49_07500 [Bacteroidia bacterium]|nr:hypothetical protein [Bacteroidia bacterium]
MKSGIVVSLCGLLLGQSGGLSCAIPAASLGGYSLAIRSRVGFLLIEAQAALSLIQPTRPRTPADGYRIGFEIWGVSASNISPEPYVS